MWVDVVTRAPTLAVPLTSKVFEVAVVPTPICEVANTFVECTLASTPRPPVVTIIAPVSLEVEWVVSVTVTLPDDISAAKIVWPTPRPPTTCKAPWFVAPAFVLSQTFVTPPTFNFSWVLIPPATLRAPVVVVVDVVVSEMWVDVVTRAPTLAVPRMSKTFEVAVVPTPIWEVANKFVVWMLDSTPTPPVVTIIAPVSLEVEWVVSVTVTLSASTFSRLASVA